MAGYDWVNKFFGGDSVPGGWGNVSSMHGYKPQAWGARAGGRQALSGQQSGYHQAMQQRASQEGMDSYWDPYMQKTVNTLDEAGQQELAGLDQGDWKRAKEMGMIGPGRNQNYGIPGLPGGIGDPNRMYQQEMARILGLEQQTEYKPGWRSR